MAQAVGSITRVLDEIRAGDTKSAEVLWRRYFPRLSALARRVLAGRELPMAAEDAVQSAFFSFLCTVERGGIRDGADRHDLWRMLSLMTVQSARKQQIREQTKRRGDDRVRAEAEFQRSDDSNWRLDNLPGRSLGPDLDLHAQELLDLLEPDLQEVALLRLGGYRNEEIKQILNCSLRSVERRLRLIRAIWAACEA
ncbi:MAG: ECF-type sigma factor [Pirellulales bacterium]